MVREPALKVILNEVQPQGEFPKAFTHEEAKKVRKFHMSFEHYEATELVALDNLAKLLGVKKIFVKDESTRFGLDAFKVLGGSYAVAKLLCEKLGMDITQVNYDYLKKEAAAKIGNLTFVTATDGNHGRGIAWAAKELGQKAIVYLPKGSAKRRVEAIEELGATAIVTDLNYDDTVQVAMEKAKEIGGYLVQDTAFEGYEDIPTWIMQGYMTMVAEALDQLALKGIEKPTHVFLQAGVGSMAGAVLGYLVNRFQGDHPTTIIVEPHAAACIYKSAEIGDGKPHSVGGDLATIAVGLACGTPNPLAWPILRDYSSMFLSCDDVIAARGVRILANPVGDDPKVVSGESGAIGVGALSLIMRNEELKQVRDALNLNENSIVLFFNTEGDTDPVNYGEILWDGKYRLPKDIDVETKC